LEAAVSNQQTDDPDPLLEFSSERSAPIQVKSAPEARKAAAQLFAAPADPAPVPMPSIPLDTLVARIDRLESALNDSKNHVSSLKSEVATLVRAINDIKRQVSRSEVNPAIGLPAAVRTPKTASAIVAALVGLISGMFGWSYFTGVTDSRLASSAAEPQEEAAFVPADQPVAPPQPEPVAAAVVPVAPRTPAPNTRVRTATAPPPAAGAVPTASRAPAPGTPAKPAPSTPAKYVGALSIDADPGGEVFVDRASVGRTPMRLDNLRAGSHLIWVEREGYRRWTRVVQVPADQLTRLFADLEPLTR
jgi:hypothetical protein